MEKKNEESEVLSLPIFLLASGFLCFSILYLADAVATTETKRMHWETRLILATTSADESGRSPGKSQRG